MNTRYLEECGSAEFTVLAALLYEPEMIRRHIDRISTSLFHSSIAKEIAGRTLQQWRDDGVPAVTLQVEAIGKTNIDPRRRQRLFSTYVDLACLANILYGGEVPRCIELLLERQREYGLESKCGALVKQHDAGRLDANGVVACMTDMVTSFDSKSIEKTLRMSDLLETDPADEIPETVKTGIYWFDESMAGGAAERGDKIVISSPPGCGKTALALQLTLSMLETNTTGTALWAMGEMTPKHLRNRSLQCLSGLSIGLLKRQTDTRRPRPAQNNRDALEHLRDIGKRMNFLQSPLTPAIIEQQIVASKASWCVVDYIQLCRGDNASDNRLEELDSIVAALARIAQIQKCVMVLISDMPKGVGKRDIFDAFKGTSEIAYMADVAFTGVVLSDDEDDSNEVTVEWRCLKNRHGAQVSMTTRFDRICQRFRKQGDQP